MSKSKFFRQKKQSDNSNELSPSVQSPPVNMEHFTEISGGDEELQRELIGLYLRQTAEDLMKLKEALAVGDKEEVKQLAHRMIGGSAAGGMTAIITPLSELEHMAK